MERVAFVIQWIQDSYEYQEIALEGCAMVWAITSMPIFHMAFSVICGQEDKIWRRSLRDDGSCPEHSH